ncbi:MAG: hypothetical protein K0R14_661 [Burkholderiales bacterium]|jgi:hypothetical protein|nr:hypothetical protein [Burkholderiales bacterium]
MKNLVKISALFSTALIILSACSNENLPTPAKLGHDVQTLPPATGIAVVAMEDLDVPEDAQLMNNQAAFKVLDNVYAEYGNKVIVKKGSIVSGTYFNNGTQCKISWNAIYVNKKQYKKKRGAALSDSIAQPSLCDPVKGIKKGQRVMIRVNNEFLD